MVMPYSTSNQDRMADYHDQPLPLLRGVTVSGRQVSRNPLPLYLGGQTAAPIQHTIPLFFKFEDHLACG